MTPTSGPLLNRRRFVGMGAALAAAMAVGFPRLDERVLAQSTEQVLRYPCAEPDTYDPGTVGGGIGIQWTNLMFEGLTRYDWENQKVVPGQAKSWDISS